MGTILLCLDTKEREQVMAEKRDELINKMSDKIVNWYGGKADWPTLVVIVHEIMALALGEALPQLAKSRKRVEVLEAEKTELLDVLKPFAGKKDMRGGVWDKAEVIYEKYTAKAALVAHGIDTKPVVAHEMGKGESQTEVALSVKPEDKE